MFLKIAGGSCPVSPLVAGLLRIPRIKTCSLCRKRKTKACEQSGQVRFLMKILALQ